MKNQLVSFFLFAAFIFVGKATSFSQQLKFETLEIDCGDIEMGSQCVKVFKFRNESDKYVLINSVESTSGITATWLHDAIGGFHDGEISFRIDTNRIGVFSKKVAVRSNDINNPVILLKIRGNIKDSKSKPVNNQTPPNK